MWLRPRQLQNQTVVTFLVYFVLTKSNAVTKSRLDLDLDVAFASVGSLSRGFVQFEVECILRQYLTYAANQMAIGGELAPGHGAQLFRDAKELLDELSKSVSV